MREKVVVFGTTELALMAQFYLAHDSNYEVVAFTVDGDFLRDDTLSGLPVVPFEEVEHIYPPRLYKMLVAVFYTRVNRTRAEKYAQAKAKGYGLISYVSSKATTWPGLKIGDNCIVFENAAIQPFVQIGNDVVIAHHDSIAHNSVIGDHCYLSSHVVVLGLVTIGDNCFLGANSTIRNNITVARDCVIGAGALILENTQEGGVYKGIQAQLLPRRSDTINPALK